MIKAPSMESLEALLQRQAVNLTTRKGVRPYAHYATYRAVYGYDHRKTQKPPLCQVTVSKAML